MKRVTKSEYNPLLNTSLRLEKKQVPAGLQRYVPVLATREVQCEESISFVICRSPNPVGSISIESMRLRRISAKTRIWAKTLILAMGYGQRQEYGLRLGYGQRQEYGHPKTRSKEWN